VALAAFYSARGVPQGRATLVRSRMRVLSAPELKPRVKCRRVPRLRRRRAGAAAVALDRAMPLSSS